MPDAYTVVTGEGEEEICNYDSHLAPDKQMSRTTSNEMCRTLTNLIQMTCE